MGLCVTITPIRYIDPSGLYYLEKDSDGRIYAIIESGDTLSGIAKGEVADPNAWRKMNYSGDPAKLQVGQRVDVTGIYNNEYKIENIVYAGKTPDGKPRRSLPPTGEPNSKDTLYNPDGTPKQDRVYGPDRNPEYDDDYNHAGDGHGIGFPHRHPWEDGVRSKNPIPVPTVEMSSNDGWGVVIIGGIVTLVELASYYYGMPVDLPGN